MAGLVLLVGLTSVMAIVLTTGDEVAETPGQGTDLTTPSLADIDLHENPEILAATRAATVAETPGQGTDLTTPSLADIDLHENPEILAATRAATVAG